MYLLVNNGSTPDTPQSVIKKDTLRVNAAACGYDGSNSDWNKDNVKKTLLNKTLYIFIGYWLFVSQIRIF